LKTAIHLNISMSDYNEMTPYELALHLEAFIERTEEEKNEKLTLVWLGEHYHRIKKLPSLKQELERLRSEDKAQPMSDEEMLKVVERLNSQFGGKVIK
jgi:hypothetical protein